MFYNTTEICKMPLFFIMYAGEALNTIYVWIYISILLFSVLHETFSTFILAVLQYLVCFIRNTGHLCCLKHSRHLHVIVI